MDIKKNDTAHNAKYVFGQLKVSINSLSETPNRGSYPEELAIVGIKDFREIYFKPCRIVYIVIDKMVSVVLIADGRRDLQKLLEKRLLR